MYLIMVQLKQAIAAEIQASRIAHRLQQQDLARLVGVTRTSISNIEHGKQGVSLSMFCRIADALNEKPEDLLSKILSHTSAPTPASSQDVKDAHIRKLINQTIE